jgi:hypothetical protein
MIRQRATRTAAIEDPGLADQTQSSAEGLLDYLKSKDEQVRRTLARKLLGRWDARLWHPTKG